MELFALLPFVLWLLCGLWASRIMAGKGRSQGAGWALGLILGLIGVLICALQSKTIARQALDAVALDAALQRLRGH